MFSPTPPKATARYKTTRNQARQCDGIKFSVWFKNWINATRIFFKEIFEELLYEDLKLYVPKEEDGSGLYYSIGFADGVIKTVMVQKSIDSSNPDYYDMFAINITQIGDVVIEIPEYTIVE